MENGQKTIFELFSGEKRFIIPKYQRAYAWEDKQRRDFLEDIKNQREDKDYFLGTILFQDIKVIREGFEQIYIVDGQQRMTTIVIFMKVLLDVLKEKDKTKDYTREMRRYLKDSDVYKLEIMHTDNEFFKTYIIDNSTVNEHSITTPSQKRLHYAKTYFYEVLSREDIGSLKKYMSKVEKSKVLTYSVNDNAEATLIFETTNDRGKTLTNLEKTKSFLMHKIYLTKENPHELINSVQDRFSEVYRILETIEQDIDDEDSILQYHFISHFDWKYTQKSKDYQMYVQKTKDKVNEMMKLESTDAVPQFIDQYSREIKETFEVYRDLLKDRNPHTRDLFILERVAQFAPLMIKCFKLDKTDGKKSYYDVVRLLEIFSFRVLGIGRKPAYTGRDWLYTLARDFNGDLNKLKVDLKKKIVEFVNENSLKEKLLSPHLYEDAYNLDLKYLLWKYENHLRTNEQPVVAVMSEEEFLVENPKHKLTVEHIACQTPQVSTSALELPEINKDFEENYLHRLGNLTFDPNSANASKGNNDIQIKNSKYFERAPFKTQNELDDFIFNKKWTRESIIKREEKILLFALSYWDPEIVRSDAITESLQEEEGILDSKKDHRLLIKKITLNLNKQFKVWDVSPHAKKTNDFKLYQSNNGNISSSYLRWNFDDARLVLEVGLWKEDLKPFIAYVQMKSQKKSDKINFNINSPDVLEALKREGFDDTSLARDNSEQLKRIDINKINEDSLSEMFIKEVQKIKPIVEKILR